MKLIWLNQQRHLCYFSDLKILIYFNLAQIIPLILLCIYLIEMDWGTKEIKLQFNGVTYTAKRRVKRDEARGDKAGGGDAATTI